MSDITPLLSDFSLVKTFVESATKEFELKNTASGFTCFVLDILLGIQDDEIEDAITDSNFLQEKKSSSDKGKDRGIDAIYIDTNGPKAVVHIFNCKYTEQFKNTTNHFPSGEIDKITGFISELMQEYDGLKASINPVLFSKVEDIWDLYHHGNAPDIVFHICSNSYYPFEDSERKRFENRLTEYKITIEYDLMRTYVDRLSTHGKQIVNARIRAIDRNYFEKSDGDIRALIVDVDAKDLVRIVIDDENLRENTEPDFSVLVQHEILEDAFEDNVRIYLKQKTRINRDIKATALSEENHRFFYFNNGITITCTKFEYQKQIRNPIISLQNLQIVNGSQTIHALYDAFRESPGKFQSVEVLTRIYETSNVELSTNIAEATNSQNPVTSRDIRANDSLQRKLEVELDKMGYYYERKKGKYAGKPRRKRIDAEKAGQALMTILNKMPAEAKDKKKLIFADKYSDVFTDQMTADDLLLAVELYNYVEQKKKERKVEILKHPRSYAKESFILHATYYIMFTISELAAKEKIGKTRANLPHLAALYDDAVTLVRNATERERAELKGHKEDYSHRRLFIGNRAKRYLEEAING